MRSLLLILAVLTLTQCQVLRKIKARNRQHTPATTEQPTAQAIGKVELVNPDDRFVLARLTMNLAMAPGTELTLLHEDGETAKAKLTPERKGVFITADIISGEPAKGDIVMIGNVKSDAPSSPAAPVIAPVGPPSAVNPPTVSISPGNPQAASPPPNLLPDKLAPSDSPGDFLRIVPKQ